MNSLNQSESFCARFVDVLADKQRLIRAQQNDEDYHEFARMLNIKRTTALAIIRRHQMADAVALLRGGA